MLTANLLRYLPSFAQTNRAIRDKALSVIEEEEEEKKPINLAIACFIDLGQYPQIGIAYRNDPLPNKVRIIIK